MLTVNNLGWVVYGAFVKDIGVTVTNAIGLVLLFAYVVALLPLANAFVRPRVPPSRRSCTYGHSNASLFRLS